MSAASLDGAAVHGTIHDRPTVDEILEAVTEYLAEDDSRHAESARRYHRLVVANLLRIVRRELALEDRHRRLHRDVLDGLGIGTLDELAGPLRRGELHPSATDLRAALREVVEAKVAVARPDHLHRPQPPHDPMTEP